MSNHISAPSFRQSAAAEAADIRLDGDIRFVTVTYNRPLRPAVTPDSGTIHSGYAVELAVTSPVHLARRHLIYLRRIGHENWAAAST